MQALRGDTQELVCEACVDGLQRVHLALIQLQANLHMPRLQLSVCSCICLSCIGLFRKRGRAQRTYTCPSRVLTRSHDLTTCANMQCEGLTQEIKNNICSGRRGLVSC